MQITGLVVSIIIGCYSILHLRIHPLLAGCATRKNPSPLILVATFFCGGATHIRRLRSLHPQYRIWGWYFHPVHRIRGCFQPDEFNRIHCTHPRGNPERVRRLAWYSVLASGRNLIPSWMASFMPVWSPWVLPQPKMPSTFILLASWRNGWEGFCDLSQPSGLDWSVGSIPFYTAFFGISLATVVRFNPQLRFHQKRGSAGYRAVQLAILTHALHNLFASIVWKPGVGFANLHHPCSIGTGWFFMLIFILIISRVEKQDLAVYLKDEVQLGTLTPVQYQGRNLRGEKSPRRTRQAL